MATRCFQSVQGLCLRVTSLDSCCRAVTGAGPTQSQFVVSDSFIDLSLTAELEEPDEFVVKTANGKLCLNEIGCATLKRYTVEVNLCNADPDLFRIIGGVTPVNDAGNNVVGYEITQALGNCGKFSLEFWTRVPSDACSNTAGETQYLYWLLPCLQNGRVGDITIENGPLNFSFSADAIPSSAWQKGPYNVVDQTDGGAIVAGPLLNAITCKTALHVQLTTVAPPCVDDICGTTNDVECGAQAYTAAGTPVDDTP